MFGIERLRKDIAALKDELATVKNELASSNLLGGFAIKALKTSKHAHFCLCDVYADYHISKSSLWRDYYYYYYKSGQSIHSCYICELSLTEIPSETKPRTWAENGVKK